MITYINSFLYTFTDLRQYIIGPYENYIRVLFEDNIIPFRFRFLGAGSAYTPMGQTNEIQEILNNIANNTNKFHFNYLHSSNPNYNNGRLTIDLTSEIQERFPNGLNYVGNGQTNDSTFVFELRYSKQSQILYNSSDPNMVDYGYGYYYYDDGQRIKRSGYGWNKYYGTVNELRRSADGVIFSINFDDLFLYQDIDSYGYNELINIDFGVEDKWFPRFGQKIINSNFVFNNQISIPSISQELSIPPNNVQYYSNQNLTIGQNFVMSILLPELLFQNEIMEVVDSSFSVSSYLTLDKISGGFEVVELIIQNIDLNIGSLFSYDLQGIDNTVFAYEVGRDGIMLNTNCLLSCDTSSSVESIFEKPKFINFMVALMISMSQAKNEGSPNPEENSKDEKSIAMAQAASSREETKSNFKKLTGVDPNTASEEGNSTSVATMIALGVFITFGVFLVLMALFKMKLLILWYLEFKIFMSWIMTWYYRLKYYFLWLLSGFLYLVVIVFEGIAKLADGIMKFIAGVLRFLKELIENYIIKPIKQFIKDIINRIKSEAKKLIPGGGNASTEKDRKIIEAEGRLEKQEEELKKWKDKCTKEEREIAEKMRKIIEAKQKIQNAMTMRGLSVRVPALDGSYVGPFPSLGLG